MNAENIKLWESVCKTDPKQVKEITGKQYKGNSPKPYYIVRRLTETFGPCGTGWGFSIVNERMERLSETDVLHVAVVRMWYRHEGGKGEIEQIGQTKATYFSAGKDGGQGKLIVDEDAPKKSVTDALVKCASYLGFAGDIFAGRWDDSKYVAELRAEFAEKASRMSDTNVSDWISYITTSANSGELKKRLAEAIEAATEVNDAAAAAKFQAEAQTMVNKAKAKTKTTAQQAEEAAQ